MFVPAMGTMTRPAAGPRPQGAAGPAARRRFTVRTLTPQEHVLTSIQRSLSCALLCSGLAAGFLSAQDKKEKAVNFTGDIGFVNTAGNSSVTSLNVGDKLTAKSGKALFTQLLAVVYGKNEGVESANSIGLRGRVDYPLTGKLSAYGFVGFERNKFAGIAHRFDEGVGLAYAAWRDAENSLDLEAGLGLAEQSLYLASTSGPTSSDNFMSGRGALNFKHLFSKVTYFQQSLEYLPSFKHSSEYRINSESALVAPISSHLGLKVGYLVKYNNAPPSAGLEKTDRLFTTGLQVSY
jgi:putative salt-induced outer membrane protein